MKIFRIVPYEFLIALVLNLMIAGAILTVHFTKPHSSLPPEIEFDISSFSLTQPETIPAIKMEEVSAKAIKAEKNAIRIQKSNDQIIQENMQEFKPEPVPSIIRPGETHMERIQEVNQIAQGIKSFDGVTNITIKETPGNLPPGLQTGASFQTRIDESQRKRQLKRYGGSELTENAVEKALKFLVSTQNPDGSWGSPESFKTGDHVALTSLSLLAFFAHGENFQSKKYSSVIKKGTDCLIGLANVPEIQYAGNGFGHAILTYALAEGYAISGSMSLKKVLEERIKIITTRQNKFGSFAPNYDNSPQVPPKEEKNRKDIREIIVGEPACDLSLLGWHIQAMTAARNAGITVKGLDRALNLAVEALVKIHQAEKGGFSQGINMK